MNSEEIVEAYGAKLDGQQYLFNDSDFILRNTPFKPINPEFDKKAIVHWWTNVYFPNGYGDNKTPQDVWKSWDTASWKYFKYIHISGYWIDTNQSSIKIACIKSDLLQPQLEELEMWLPGIKGNPKKVSILEESLSEHGSYNLVVYEKQQIITKTTYGSISHVKEFTNLSDAVDFIRTRLYYKKR